MFILNFESFLWGHTPRCSQWLQKKEKEMEKVMKLKSKIETGSMRR
jgi:hypothetical protein